MKLSGWGRYPALDAKVRAPRDNVDVQRLVVSEPTLIARGYGRAYGDSAINISCTLDMRKQNRMLGFDSTSGQLVVEAGVSLAEIIATFLPRGWFLKITPGTKFVSIGGAIAADVHGKNHHKHGSFRSCVDWVELMGRDGRLCRCSPWEDPQLFDNTLGGMGLTGPILRAAISLRPVESGWIRQTTIAAPNLAATMRQLEGAQDATYSVAWIDCLGSGSRLGRSLIMLGEHATRLELPEDAAQAPFKTKTRSMLPAPAGVAALVLNKLNVRAFNALYYRAGVRDAGVRLVDWDRYFYPLDCLRDWNMIYGRRGFCQFQCVLPLDHSEDGLSALLDEIVRARAGSFLAVLKKLGKQDSAFSFPMEGYTLALDFPVNERTLNLLNQLDQITLAHKGRFYLAKDSRMTAETLHASDARLGAFKSLRDSRGFTGHFRSAQSDRLAL